MVPVIELRGAIPVGISLGLSPVLSTIISILGSTVIVPPVILFVKPVFNWLKHHSRIGGIVDRLTNRAMSKGANIKKYAFWGLLIFVGIPLPGTGAWTGSLIAALFDINIKIALPAIFLGNVMAGIIIYLLSYSALSLIKLI